MSAPGFTLAHSPKQALPAAPSQVRPQPRASIGNQALLRRLQPKLTVSAIDDPLEREADNVADMVMRKEKPALVLTRAPTAVSRKCAACKERDADLVSDQVAGVPDPALSIKAGPPRISRKCAACQEENAQILQSKPGQAFKDSAQAVSDSVHATMRGPAQPLDASSREFFEPRFGRNFADVQLHDNGQAAISARMLGAQAYTLGNHIAFAAGRYDPASESGRRLLGHELAHVVQQSDISARSTVQRQAEDESGAPPPAMADKAGPGAQGSQEQLVEQPKAVCGPDVTKQLKDAQLKTIGKFDSWKPDRRESACQDLVSIIFGSIAWDIIQLNESDWIAELYRPPCASDGAVPSCTKSVQIDNQCFYAGSVNYVHFGNMFDLCQKHYATAYPLNNQFTQNEMMKWIDLHKTHWFSPDDANIKTAKDWAAAGFFNWPHGALTPAGDRPNCAPSCPTPYSGGTFDVNWSGETF
jgi:hypothetical protein